MKNQPSQKTDDLPIVSTAEEIMIPPTNRTADFSDDIPNRELGDNQEFFIPIHDFVRFTNDEIEIINHPAFQRLGMVYQLGQAHLLYRGATHKRMEHVLGTVWVATKICNALHASYHRSKNKDKTDESRCSFARPPSLIELRFIRLAALLHDIGHLPAGHTLEDELGMLDAHDGEKRLHLVLNKEDWIQGMTSPRLGDLIDNLYKVHLNSSDVTITPQKILKKLISKDEKIVTPILLEIRLEVCRDIVGNTICADLLDYLHRDWFHIGKPKFFDRRLLEYMQIRNDQYGSPKLVISYGQRRRPKRDAISSILELLESRYNLGESVLFHPTKCAAAAMLERGLWELYAAVPKSEQEAWLKNLENRLLACSDEEMIAEFLKEAIQKKCKPSITLFQCLTGRELYKSVEVVYHGSFRAADRELLQDRYLALKKGDSQYKPNQQQRQDAAEKRVGGLIELEQEFGFDRGSLVMYCPSRKMNSKIAEVKIIYNDSIHTLHEWDGADDKLAGGHCKAQMDRFTSLWRVEVYVSRATIQKVQDSLGEEQAKEYMKLLRRAVKAVIFGVMPVDHGITEELVLIAKSLTNFSESPYYGWKALSVAAARDVHERDRYPLDAPRLRTFLIRK